MRPFVLCAKVASAYYDSLAAAGCPSSQIAIVKLSAVPLWKVIVGPRADELQTGPARVRFSFSPAGEGLEFLFRDPQGSGFLFHILPMALADACAPTDCMPAISRSNRGVTRRDIETACTAARLILNC
jgi:hypothetical protein